MTRIAAITLLFTTGLFGQETGEPFERILESVFRVETETGHGSGFLVDAKKGWVATNHHVIRMGNSESRHNAVVLRRQDGGEVRVGAVVRHSDGKRDLALLQVHPPLLEGRAAIPVSPDDIRIGEKVAAIGDPISLDQQVTFGRISSIRKSYGTGDFLILEGNSGGPVVREIDGALVGVSAFGVGGFAGFIPAPELAEFMAEAETGSTRRRMGSAIGEPATKPLKNYRYPGNYPMTRIMSQVEAIIDQKPKSTVRGPDSRMQGVFLNEYETDSFRVSIATPPIVAYYDLRDELIQIANRRRRRGKRIRNKAADDSAYKENLIFYAWADAAARNEIGLANAVTVFAQPKEGETTGSIWKRAFGLTYRINLKYKGEFDRMRLIADGRVLEPVKRKKMLTESALSGYFVEFRDEAYFGAYQYDIEDFRGVEELKIELWDARRPNDPHRKKIGTSILRRIESDLASLEGIFGEAAD